MSETQLTLEDALMHFDGRTVSEDPDAPRRLTGQMLRVFEAMSDHGWWTIADLAARCGGSEPAISARIRDLRKIRHGAWVVERECVGRGLFRYRLTGETLAESA